MVECLPSKCMRLDLKWVTTLKSKTTSERSQPEQFHLQEVSRNDENTKLNIGCLGDSQGCTAIRFTKNP